MLTISATWDRTSEWLADNMAAVTRLAAALIWLPTVLSSVIDAARTTATPGPTLGLGLASLVLSLAVLLGQAALTVLVLDTAPDVGGAIRLAMGRIGAVIGVSLALFAAFLLAFLPPIVLLAADGIDLAAMAQGVAPNFSPATIAIVVLYVVVAVPFLIWVAARLMPLIAVVVRERRGLGAITHAFRLTRGLGGRLAGALILFGVVGGVAALATRTVFGSILRIVAGGHGPLDLASVITILLVALVSTIATVIITVFAAKVYAACTAGAGSVSAA